MSKQYRLEKLLLFSLLPGALPLLVKGLVHVDRLASFPWQIGDLLGIGVGSATFALLEMMQDGRMSFSARAYGGALILLALISTAVMYTKDEYPPQPTFLIVSAVITLMNILISFWLVVYLRNLDRKHL